MIPNVENFWLGAVIVSNFFSAAVVLIDKYIVALPTIIKPVVYVFFISFLSIFAILILPFGVVLAPTIEIILLSLAAAGGYIAFLILFYRSLKLADASDVAPATGAVSTIATLIFSFLILKTVLSANFLPGAALLVGGTLFLSHLRFPKKVFAWVLAAGVFFGLSAVLIKMMFNITPFWNAFFWSRLANVAGAFLLLILPANRKTVAASLKKSPAGTKTLILANKVLGGLAFLLFLTAVKLGNVSLTNALVGIQYVFLLVFALMFSRRFPEYFSEKIHSRNEIFHKTLATAVIVLGFFIVFS